jgi:hypothetical protein
MLGLMRNSSLPLADRFLAAQIALPLVHPKLTASQQRSSEAYGFGVPGVNVKDRSGSGPRVSPTAETGDQVLISTYGVDLSPLDFFPKGHERSKHSVSPTGEGGEDLGAICSCEAELTDTAIRHQRSLRV